MPKQNNKFDKDSLNDMLPEDFTTQTKSNEQTAHSKQSTVAEDSVQKKSEHDSTQEDHSTDAPIESLKRPRGKQLKTSLEEYRQQFLQVPRIADRKPVFVSSSTRDLLDCIVRKLGDRKMSVSGLIENLALHHLKTYQEDIEQWRKL